MAKANEVLKLIEESGFDVDLQKSNIGYMLHIAKFTPHKEYWEEFLYIGKGRICDVAEAISDRRVSFDVTEEYSLRYDTIGKRGYPATSAELLEDLEFMWKELKALDKSLEKYASNTKYLVARDVKIER